MRDEAFEAAYSIASSKINRFNRLGRKLSQNDVKIVFYSQLLVELSPGRNKVRFCADFEHLVANANDEIGILWKSQAESQPEQESLHYQLALF